MSESMNSYKVADKKVTDAEIEEALIGSKGILSGVSAYIAKHFNKKMSRQGAEKRIYKSKRLQKVRQEVDESTLDFAESKLFEHLARGDKTAIIFYLKCKGKGRGYVERTEIDPKGPLIQENKQQVIDMTGMSKEEIDSLAEKAFGFPKSGAARQDDEK